MQDILGFPRKVLDFVVSGDFLCPLAQQVLRTHFCDGILDVTLDL